jgi:hypothetical protein
VKLELQERRELELSRLSGARLRATRSIVQYVEEASNDTNKNSALI